MAVHAIITTITIFSTLISITLTQCVYASSKHCQEKNFTFVKPRRYDINDLGYKNYFRGWVDVQGQGAANDYCRIVDGGPRIHLACALAGTHGESEVNYVSAKLNFELGFDETWYMKDEDGDGRDDYCRCLAVKNEYLVICTRAGPKGFFGSTEQGGSSSSFTPTGPTQCKDRKVRPEFGKINSNIYFNSSTP